jgi:hypothetical protein
MAVSKGVGAMAKMQIIFTVRAGLGLLAAGCGAFSSTPAKNSAGTPTTTSKEENALPSQL